MTHHAEVEQLAGRIQRHINQNKSPSLLMAQLIEEGLGFILPMIALKQLTGASIKELKDLARWFDQDGCITNEKALDEHIYRLFQPPAPVPRAPNG